MNQMALDPSKTRAEQTLFTGQFQHLIVTFFTNERPPRGLAGRLDWYFHGAISQQLQQGAITGKLGECVYLPLRKKQGTYHLLLLGCGESQEPGLRTPVPQSGLQVLKKNLHSLKWKTVGISLSDFGQKTPSELSKTLEGVQLWIAS